MKEKGHPIQWNPDSLIQLLKLADEVPDEVASECREETLSRVLYNYLPPGKEQLSFLPEIIKHAFQSTKLISDQSVLELLTEPSTDLCVLKRIKEYGRDQSHSKHSTDLREIGSLIYYCGIARALISHNSKITRLSYRQLEDKFCRISKKKWIQSELRDLLSQGYHYCHKKASND